MSDDLSPDLEAALQRWFEGLEGGREPKPSEICPDDPELLADLERILSRDQLASRTLKIVNGPEPEEVRSRRVPANLGDFVVCQRLGAGAMGEVYLARQKSLGRLVALKVLRPDAGRDDRLRQRFFREAEIAASLEHPNIVPIFAVGEADGFAYIAMKVLSGPALDKAPQPMPAGQVARIGVAVALALQEAHATGVIHRDVKPANIVLDSGVPYVLDFGLARGDQHLGLTATGTTPGTVPYMSPEQIRAGSSTTTLDARTDIYSLGATLYQMASGHPPFWGNDAASCIRKILETEPKKIEGVDRDLQTIVLRALEKDRERRFASAESLADDLQRYLDGRPIVSRPAGPWVRLTKLVRRHRRTSLFVGTMLIVVLALGAILSIRSLREAERRQAELTQIREELSLGNLELARALIQKARERYGDDGGLGSLAARRRARVLLADLLDALQERAEAQDRPSTHALVEEIRTLDALVSPEAIRELALARVADALLARKGEHAQALLADIEPGRDTAALAAALSRSSEWKLPDPTGHGATEFAFSLIAMRLADRPGAEQLREAGLARRRFFHDQRVRYAELLVLAEQGGHDDAVLQGLLGVQQEGRYRRGVLRNLLRQSLVLGRMPFARRLLAEFREDWPEATWSGVDAAMVVEALWRQGETDEAQSVLERAATRFPESFSLWVMRARAAVARGDADGVRAALERSAEVAQSPAQGDLARSQLLALEARALPAWDLRGLAPIEASQREGVESLLGRVEQFLTGCRSPKARTEASVLASRLLLLLGRHAECQVRLSEALSGPLLPAARLERGLQAFVHYQVQARADQSESAKPLARAMSEVFGALNRNATEGMEQLDLLIASAEGGLASARPEQLAQAHHYRAALAFFLGRFEESLESIDLALEIYEEHLSSRERAYLAQLRRAAARRRR